VLGLKQAFYVKPEREVIPYDEAEVRERIVDQLNPNLLFASFQSLQNLIKSGSTASVKMIYYISVYLRGNLQAVELSGEMIDFEEELEHIIAYLQLQKTRNGNLNFALECKVKEFKVPRHSLVPMVENAVKYGIAGKGDQGNIVIRTYLRAEGYAIQVIDDGIGFDQSILKRNSPTALLSLSDLLEQKCNAMMEIISKEGKGTVITIVLPMLDNESEEELAPEDLME
ncbi:MAG: histidine kinase, partial [Lachnospiraceae bacterium]|nr:histidine kinase [Lachnospiraceae bacterium]